MPYVYKRNLNRKSRRERLAEWKRNDAAISAIISQMPNDTMADKLARVCMMMQLRHGYKQGARYA